ncbi:helix-turn-helix transcriptional regulator [Streptomyces sp. 891-h]|uniref:response regulator transcription factor n=1 Tax=Streptomyces sp. 891-h TaxID=2720714 RepID=UPI001FAA29DF|nr:helix-turn-helix transcriptional regulator [Streptomyces sp. 891-h]UNZ20593.1 helix-turn-helix transcriptional regulator [Streptomyces sp. 891-h]
MTGPVLSERELEVLRRMSEGASYRLLGRELGVDESTVRSHGSHALRKLGAHTIAHAVLLACRAGLLDGRPRRHGDHAGFAAHMYRGEEPCEACREGDREYRRRLKARRKAAEPPHGRQSAAGAREAPEPHPNPQRPSSGRTVTRTAPATTTPKETAA